jgi:hypothetical protein
LGKPLQETPLHIDDRIEQGLRGFLWFLQQPEHQEKLDAYLMGLAAQGHTETAQKIEKLLRLNPESVALSLTMILLDDPVLDALREAFAGQWHVQPLSLEAFIRQIAGRRLSSPDLKRIFDDWLGETDKTIFWIKAESSKGWDWFSESLAKYGPAGKQLLAQFKPEDFPEPDQVESTLADNGKIRLLEDLSLQNYSLDELKAFLSQEKLMALKKRLRTELFFRMQSQPLKPENWQDLEDEPLADLLQLQLCLQEAAAHPNVECFSRGLAPGKLFLEKLRHADRQQDLWEDETLPAIEKSWTTLCKRFEQAPWKQEGAKSLEAIKADLNGVVVVLDGLRYDLWLALKPLFQKAGWALTETPFFIEHGSTTEGFRHQLDPERIGTILGKSYVLWTWAEKHATARNIKKILAGPEAIKIFHFNFIDVRLHGAALDPYPLYQLIQSEFLNILPLLELLPSFYLLPDHGFAEHDRLKDRYTHGGKSTWETILPWVRVKKC